MRFVGEGEGIGSESVRSRPGWTTLPPLSSPAIPHFRVSAIKRSTEFQSELFRSPALNAFAIAAAYHQTLHPLSEPTFEFCL